MGASGPVDALFSFSFSGASWLHMNWTHCRCSLLPFVLECSVFTFLLLAIASMYLVWLHDRFWRGCQRCPWCKRNRQRPPTHPLLISSIQVLLYLMLPNVLPRSGLRNYCLNSSVRLLHLCLWKTLCHFCCTPLRHSLLNVMEMSTVLFPLLGVHHDVIDTS